MKTGNVSIHRCRSLCPYLIRRHIVIRKRIRSQLQHLDRIVIKILGGMNTLHFLCHRDRILEFWNDRSRIDLTIPINKWQWFLRNHSINELAGQGAEKDEQNYFFDFLRLRSASYFAICSVGILTSGKKYSFN